jgi:adenylosuccinate lyase
VIDKLVVYPDNMLATQQVSRSRAFAARILLALTQAGVSREDAYRLVQRNAMKVWEQGKDFLEELLADEDVRRRSPRRRSARSSISATTPSTSTRPSDLRR